MLRGLILGTALIGMCVSAAAQTATGILEGRVTDVSDSAVPDAKITIENQLTGVQQSSVTSSDGIFAKCRAYAQKYAMPAKDRP